MARKWEELWNELPMDIRVRSALWAAREMAASSELERVFRICRQVKLPDDLRHDLEMLESRWRAIAEEAAAVPDDLEARLTEEIGDGGRPKDSVEGGWYQSAKDESERRARLLALDWADERPNFSGFSEEDLAWAEKRNGYPTAQANDIRTRDVEKLRRFLSR